MPTVKTINIQEVEEKLKDCPKEVRNYVKQLKESNKRKQALISELTTKLRK